MAALRGDEGTGSAQVWTLCFASLCLPKDPQRLCLPTPRSIQWGPTMRLSFSCPFSKLSRGKETMLFRFCTWKEERWAQGYPKVSPHQSAGSFLAGTLPAQRLPQEGLSRLGAAGGAGWGLLELAARCLTCSPSHKPHQRYGCQNQSCSPPITAPSPRIPQCHRSQSPPDVTWLPKVSPPRAGGQGCPSAHL